MWKDFFYYSKSERRSILVLTSIGILLLLLGTWTHMTKNMDLPSVDSLSVDSFCVRVYQRKVRRDSFPCYNRPARIALALDYFDPNMADSAALCKLGLPSFLARRIVNYRLKGGVFRKKEDLARIYGLSEEQYQALKPYILIDETSLNRHLVADNSLVTDIGKGKGGDTVQHRQYATSRVVVRDSSLMKYPEGTVVDLNQADTFQLKKIPGIGSGLAKMIIAYRKRLGGYAAVEQLQEIGYVDAGLNKWFKVESAVSRPLKVNRAGLDQLRNHPYMNFYMAKAILEYRRKRGKIKGLSQLSMFQEFTEKDLQRLKPYLDFE